MTDNFSTQSLNSCMHPIPMFLLNLLFQNSSHATSVHSNPFLLSPHRICRAALPISSSSFSKNPSCQPSSVNFSPFFSTCHILASWLLHSPSRQYYCSPLPVSLWWSPLDFISSLCTFLTLQRNPTSFLIFFPL